MIIILFKIIGTLWYIKKIPLILTNSWTCLFKYKYHSLLITSNNYFVCVISKLPFSWYNLPSNFSWLITGILKWWLWYDWNVVYASNNISNFNVYMIKFLCLYCKHWTWQWWQCMMCSKQAVVAVCLLLQCLDHLQTSHMTDKTPTWVQVSVPYMPQLAYAYYINLDWFFIHLSI